jgi:fatty acid desaturase
MRTSTSNSRGTRAIPAIATPKLSAEQTQAVFAHERRLALFMIVRVILGVVTFVVGAATRRWLVLVPAMWITYGGAITAVHHLIHASLGLSAGTRRFWLTTLAAVVGESGHALQATHLLHHRTDPTLPDPEGAIEYVAWKNMPIEALAFRIRLMHWGLVHGTRKNRVRAEVGFSVIAHLVAIASLPFTVVPALYVGGLTLASAFFAVLAGKGPQTNWGRNVESPLVKVSCRMFRWVLFSHDRHLEHHAFPKVPLPRLRLLDATSAELFSGSTLVRVSLP